MNESMCFWIAVVLISNQALTPATGSGAEDFAESPFLVDLINKPLSDSDLCSSSYPIERLDDQDYVLGKFILQRVGRMTEEQQGISGGIGWAFRKLYPTKIPGMVHQGLLAPQRLSVFTGRVYVKPNSGFERAQKDFWSLNPTNVIETRKPGELIGDVQDKKVYLHRWEYNWGSIQVKQGDGIIKRTMLTVSYPMPRQGFKPWGES